MVIPKWLNSIKGDDEVKKIEEAVKRAESKTSGEIVPIIVLSSSKLSHVYPIISLLFFLLFFVVIDLAGWPYSNIYKFIGLLGLAALAFLLSRNTLIQRLFLPHEERQDQVFQRALLEFYEHKIHHTERSTGILLMVSLTEHQAVVMGDKAISEKIDQATWQKAVDVLLAGIKRKQMVQGYCDAISFCGEILAEHFPISENDRDELNNRLIIKE